MIEIGACSQPEALDGCPLFFILHIQPYFRPQSRLWSLQRPEVDLPSDSDCESCCFVVRVSLLAQVGDPIGDSNLFLVERSPESFPAASPRSVSVRKSQNERFVASISLHVLTRSHSTLAAILQRVLSASVTVEGQLVSSIGRGVLVFAAMAPGDGEKEAESLAAKVLKIKMWDDDESGGRVISPRLYCPEHWSLTRFPVEEKRPRHQRRSSLWYVST